MLPICSRRSRPRIALKSITTQKKRPIESSTCQKRPRSRYSKPWLPNQAHRSPVRPKIPAHSPMRLPKTTMARAPSSPKARRRWPCGSLPAIIGARKMPAARKEVATQKMASCTCQVRMRL